MNVVIEFYDLINRFDTNRIVIVSVPSWISTCIRILLSATI